MSARVRLVVVMDPIEAIKPAKDSTLAILLAAQARGWELFYTEQKDLYLRDGVAWAHLAPLQVFDDLRVWFTRGATLTAKLGDYDAILMRKDPPFDTNTSIPRTSWTVPNSKARSSSIARRDCAT